MCVYRFKMYNMLVLLLQLYTMFTQTVYCACMVQQVRNSLMFFFTKLTHYVEFCVCFNTCELIQ